MNDDGPISVPLASLALALIVTMAWIATPASAEFDPSARLHRAPGSPQQSRTSGAGTVSPQGAGLQSAQSPSGETPYHFGATLVCSDCHSVHYSETHDLQGNAGQGAPALQGGPTAKLLRRGSALDLCLACHDGQSGMPDVVGADSNGLAQRAAGHFGAPGEANFRGHNLSGAPGDLCTRCHWQGMAGGTVQCIDCHNQHGNGRYRNLQWASWPGGEPMIKAFIRPGVAGLQRYERVNIAYPAPTAGDGSFREVTNICIDCHHSFFAPSYTGSTSPYHRHPGVNSEWDAYYPIDRPGAGTDPANWTSGGVGFTAPRVGFVVAGASDFSAASTVAASNQVFCLSCHRAHGSDQAFSTVWDYGNRNAAGCQQCHNR